jgi:hypothetical protein
MARPGFIHHRKFKRLSRALGSPALARGCLEMLWDTCYEAGDDYLGTAEDVELSAYWDGEPGVLCEALLTAGGEGNPGFIEEVSGRPGHYRVHDLYDHAPEYVQKRMAREAERIAKGQTISEIRSAAGKRGRQSQLAAALANVGQTSGKRRANGGQTADTCPQKRANGGQAAANGGTPAPAPAPTTPKNPPPLRYGGCSEGSSEPPAAKALDPKSPGRPLEALKRPQGPATPAGSPVPGLPGPVPLNGGAVVALVPALQGAQVPISQSQVDEWAKAYPAVDVPLEIRRAIAWLNASPTRLKTPRGVPRFLVSWFGRTQDQGGSKGVPPKGKGPAFAFAPPGPKGIDPDLAHLLRPDEIDFEYPPEPEEAS